MPPMKYTARNLLIPTIWNKTRPKKNSVSILPKMCQKPAWTNMLVIIVHGFSRKSAGDRLRLKARLPEIVVAMYITMLRTIITSTGFCTNHSDPPGFQPPLEGWAERRI